MIALTMYEWITGWGLAYFACFTGVVCGSILITRPNRWKD